MRYAIIIPDGAADEPHPDFGNRTALDAADIPHLHRLAREGTLGLAATVPGGFSPGSDVANLSVFGYEPAAVYTGRAPLEAASMGIKLAPNEHVFRANMVTIEAGMMKDYSAGHIPTDESRPLIEQLARDLEIDGVTLYPGISYRHACVIADIPGDAPSRTPPHDILDQPVDQHNPGGEFGSWVLEVERDCEPLLAKSEINQARVARGVSPVTNLWLWGGGKMPVLQPFVDRFGVRGGLISAVDLLKGIGILAGLDVLDVPGATGFTDTDYAAKGAAAVEYLQDHALIAVHIEAPDEAGHSGDAAAKVKALEEIDRHIVAPLLAEAERANDLRILLMPDHPTPIARRTHTRAPVPYALWGAGFAARGGDRFTEAAAAGDAPIHAPELMRILTRVES